jgi:site-specific recombinase XerD
VAPRPTGILAQLSEALRVRHYNRRTEEAYVGWARRFATFHGHRDPRGLGTDDISRFISSLADRGVSASTQNQALSAVLFLFQEVLGVPIQELAAIVRAQRPMRLPLVLSRAEVAAVLRQLSGVEWLMASLLYGCGLRVMECVEFG